MRTLLVSLLMLTCATAVHAQNAPKDMMGVRTSFAPAVKDVAPAVVNISTKKVVRQQVSPFANDPFFQMCEDVKSKIYANDRKFAQMQCFFMSKRIRFYAQM